MQADSLQQVILTWICQVAWNCRDLDNCSIMLAEYSWVWNEHQTSQGKYHIFVTGGCASLLKWLPTCRHWRSLLGCVFLYFHWHRLTKSMCDCFTALSTVRAGEEPSTCTQSNLTFTNQPAQGTYQIKATPKMHSMPKTRQFYEILSFEPQLKTNAEQIYFHTKKEFWGCIF